VSLAQTRKLLSYSIRRALTDSVWLNFIEKTPNGDGSFTTTYRPEQVMARVVALSQADIQRLQSAGITLFGGVSVALPYEVQTVPDSVIYESATYKVESFTVAQGASIFILPEKPIGSAVIEANA